MSAVGAGRSEADNARPAIRRAASVLFAARGFEATTVREIAAAVGIQSATLYYYYADKQQILFELVAETLADLVEGTRVATAAEDAPAYALAAVTTQHVVLHALRPREAALGDTELRSLSGERLTSALALRDSYEAIVVGILEDGARAGVMQPLDPKLTAYAVIAMCTNVGIWFRPDGRLPLADIVHAHARMALRLAAGPDIGREATDRLTRAAISRYAAPDSEVGPWP